MKTAADPMFPIACRVRKVKKENQDTVTLEIEPQGYPPPSFLPGQFNMLYAFGIGEAPISISGGDSESGLLVHTVRAVGAVTKAICGLRSGDRIGLRGPFGSGWPVRESEKQELILVAGGIGLAPLRPVLHRIARERKKFKRAVLLYGARSPQELLYRDWLERWRSQNQIEVHVTVDRADAAWHENVGVVTALLNRMELDPPHSVAMVCGPEIMMRFSVTELEKRGVLPDRIYISMERNMKCAVGLCGHCQFGPVFICKDGPVFRYDRIKTFFAKREI